jgi:hypothetical protein
VHLGLEVPKIRVHRCRTPCKFVVGSDPLSKYTVRVKKSRSLIVLVRAGCFPPLSPGILVSAITITCQQCVIRCHGNVPHKIFIAVNHMLWHLMFHDGRFVLLHVALLQCILYTNNTLSLSSPQLCRNAMIAQSPCLCQICSRPAYMDDGRCALKLLSILATT